MPLDLCCWQVRLKKKQPSTTVRTFHTCRKGSRCFVLPASCPWGCLLFCDLRRSRVWSEDDERSLQEVCRKGWWWQDPGEGSGTQGGWVGVELLWAAGLDTDTLQMSPECGISLQCNSVQSFTAWKPSQRFWSPPAPGDLGREEPCFSRHVGHQECWSLPYSKNTGKNHGLIES